MGYQAVKLAEKAAIKEAAAAAKAAARATMQANKKVTSKVATLQELLIDVSSPIDCPETTSSFDHLLDEFREQIEESGSRVQAFDTTENLWLKGLNILRFRRILKKRYDGDKKQWFAFPPGRSEVVPESTTIVYLSASELADHIQEGTLIGLPAMVRKGLGMGHKAQVVLFVQGLVKYLGKKKAKDSRDWRERVREEMGEAAAAGPMRGRGPRKAAKDTLGREEADRELVQLQVLERCFVMLGMFAQGSPLLFSSRLFPLFPHELGSIRNGNC